MAKKEWDITEHNSGDVFRVGAEAPYAYWMVVGTKDNNSELPVMILIASSDSDDELCAGRVATPDKGLTFMTAYRRKYIGNFPMSLLGKIVKKMEGLHDE
jgi:hypothetical protein